MGWTAYYQILRDRPLDDQELVALRDFINRTNTPRFDSESFRLAVTRETRPDRVLAEGWTKLPHDLEESSDHERLCAALTAMPTVLAGIEVRVTDDFKVFGIEDGVVSMEVGPGPPLVDVPADDLQLFQAPESYVGDATTTLSPDVIATMQTIDEGNSPTDAALSTALTALAELEHGNAAIFALSRALASAPAVRLAAAGLAHYAEVCQGTAARDLVVAAVDRAIAQGEVDAIAEPFLEMWDDPQGIYWYGDMAWADASRAALARHPEVEAQLIADLDAALAGASKELTHRRAGAAAMMLGLGCTSTALRVVIAGLRATRGRDLSTNLRYHTRDGLERAVATMRVDTTVPTLLLEASGPYHRAQRFALEALGELAPSRAAPFARALVAHGVGDALIELLAAAGDDASLDTLRVACTSPNPWIRKRATEVLTAGGHTPPPPSPLLAPEELVTHAQGPIRHEALVAIDKLDDASLLSSFLAAFELDRAIRLPYENHSTAFRFRDRVPSKIQRASLDEQLAWVRSQADLPAQTVWPSVQALVGGGAAAVATLAATYPRPWQELDEAGRAALEAEEAALLDALTTGHRDALVVLEDAAMVGPPVTLVPVDYPAAPRPVVLAPQPAPTIAVAEPAPTHPRITPLPIPPDPVAPAPAPFASPPPVDAELAATIDELIGALGDDTPSPALIARTGLPAQARSMNRWDRARAIRDRLLALGAIPVATRLLDRLHEIHRQNDLREVCDAVLPVAAVDPTIAARIGQVWDDIFSTPWESPSTAGDLLQSVAPALFARAVEQIAAPDDDDPLRHRTYAAFEVLGNQRDRKAEAIDVLIARIRADRGLPRNVVNWRSEAYRALRKTGAADAVPTAILELAERATGDTGLALLELLATVDGPAIAALAAAVDLPGFAVDATKERCRSRWSNEATRRSYLAHPFWKVRLAAADACSEWDRSRAERYSIWKAIDAAGLPDVERDRGYARPHDATAETTWDEMLRPLGGAVEVAPFPALVDGLASPCSDLRAWSLRAVDLRAAPADAVARVFADELDLAMVDRGHRRNGARWSRWRAVAGELDAGRAARTAWARANADARLPPLLARVRDEGAAAVAAELPLPYLPLTADERAAREAAERPFAERGAALLRDGVAVTALEPIASPPRFAPGPDSYF